MAGRRQSIIENPFHGSLRRERLNEARQYRADMIRIVRHVRVEERLDDDLERESRHIAREIPVFTILPAGDRAFGILDHPTAIRADPLAVKSRLCEPALTSPEIAFARHKPISDEAMEERRSQ